MQIYTWRYRKNYFVSNGESLTIFWVRLVGQMNRDTLNYKWLQKLRLWSLRVIFTQPILIFCKLATFFLHFKKFTYKDLGLPSF